MSPARRCFYSFIFSVTAGLAQAGDLQVGDVAPNWILMDKGGETVSLYQQADSGRTTVMVFCASWCEKCRKLLPEVQALQTAHVATDPQASFYVMNVWEDGDPVAFVQDQAPSLPLVLRAEHVAKRYSVDVTPGVVVVGPDRKIIYQHTPGTALAETTEQLKRIISGTPGEGTP